LYCQCLHATMFLSSVRFFILSCAAAKVAAQISAGHFSTFPNVLELSADFDPVVANANSTGGMAHHRNTPFAVSFPHGI
jgi:hypothetical protein